MKIDFISLEFKNVLSYGNSPTLFEFKNGIDLINAKNGAGKSSFVDGLTFSLYGVPFRKIKKGSLINHHNNKNLLTTLIFFIENSGYYKIIRGMKPNIFEIYHNKETPEFDKELHLIPQSAKIDDYQTLLETDILRMSENVYRQLIVLGANISTSKNFMDLNSKEKEEIFQIITDTSVFNSLKVLINKKISLFKTYVLEHEYKVNILSNTLMTEKRNIESLEQQNEVIKNDKNRIIEELNKELNDRVSKIPEYEKAIEMLKELKTQYDKEKSELMEKKESHKNLLNKQRSLSDELHHIDRAKAGVIVCDECENHINLSNIDISDEHKQKVNKEYDTITTSISDIDIEIHNLNESVNKKYEKLLNSKRIVTNQKENLDRIEYLKNDIISKSDWAEFVIDYSNIEKIESDLEDEKQHILSLKESVNNYDMINSIIGEDKLKGFMLSQQIPVLNRYINQFIERFNAFDYNFVIDTSFKERIISRNEEKEFNAMSNGQKQRFTFSILFAFLKLVEEKNGISTNLLILDEVLDSSSDTEGKLELIKILTDDFAKMKNVIIISHNPDIVQNVEDFNRVIRVEHDIYSKMIME